MWMRRYIGWYFTKMPSTYGMRPFRMVKTIRIWKDGIRSVGSNLYQVWNTSYRSPCLYFKHFEKDHANACLWCQVMSNGIKFLSWLIWRIWWKCWGQVATLRESIWMRETGRRRDDRCHLDYWSLPGRPSRDAGEQSVTNGPASPYRSPYCHSTEGKGDVEQGRYCNTPLARFNWRGIPLQTRSPWAEPLGARWNHHRPPATDKRGRLMNEARTPLQNHDAEECDDARRSWENYLPSAAKTTGSK